MGTLKKYGQLLLGVATIGGAILTQSFTNNLTPPSGDYVLISGTWEPKSNYPLGDCTENPSADCSYEKIGSAPGPMNDEFRNPANFQTVDHGKFETNEE
ncbi:hypothetical protein [uncultured Sphingobacterium sp.]|uniref:hypothetical protein n=1 Tax=uncultured Sphingobacterium sp. TaxID=182688 RepID=UPI00374A5D6C